MTEILFCAILLFGTMFFYALIGDLLYALTDWIRSKSEGR